MTPVPRPMIFLWVSDLTRSHSWYAALGFVPRRRGRSGQWAELEWPDGGVLLGLHAAALLPPPGRASLCFEVPDIDRWLAALQSAGLNIPEFILDEGFGRSAVLHDPDGTPVQLNEHLPELYA